MLKNLSPKQLLLAAITAFTALYNLFTPLFHVVGYTVFGKTWAVNGYQIAFGAAGDEYSEFLFRDSYVWYMIGNWIHILVSVAVIALLVYVFLKRRNDFAKASFIAVAASVVISLLYMINGIASSCTLDGSYTVAYVPFIIVALLAVGYFVCDKLLPENFGK